MSTMYFPLYTENEGILTLAVDADQFDLDGVRAEIEAFLDKHGEDTIGEEMTQHQANMAATRGSEIVRAKEVNWEKAFAHKSDQVTSMHRAAYEEFFELLDRNQK